MPARSSTSTRSLHDSSAPIAELVRNTVFRPTVLIQARYSPCQPALQFSCVVRSGLSIRNRGSGTDRRPLKAQTKRGSSSSLIRWTTQQKNLTINLYIDPQLLKLDNVNTAFDLNTTSLPIIYIKNMQTFWCVFIPRRFFVFPESYMFVRSRYYT